MKYESNRIYSTTDYSIFKIMDENRSVTEARKNKIKKSIEQVNLRAPIKVNENMEVIDGQGRLAALKELGKPVEFFVAPGEGVNECIQMNKVNSKWTALDYVDSYAAAGNPSYVNLKRIIAGNPEFPANLVIRIVSSNADRIDSFGNLDLTGEVFVKAQLKMDVLRAIIPVYPKIKGRKQNMCHAFIKCVEYGMDKNVLARKMDEYPGRITGGIIRDNILLLETIYNKGMRAEKRVYATAEYDKEKAGIR